MFEWYEFVIFRWKFAHEIQFSVFADKIPNTVHNRHHHKLYCCVISTYHPHRIYYVQLFFPFQMVVILPLLEGTFANRRNFCVHNILLSAQTIFMCWNIKNMMRALPMFHSSCCTAQSFYRFDGKMWNSCCQLIWNYYRKYFFYLLRFDKFIIFVLNFYEKKMVAVSPSADLFGKTIW